MFKIPKQEYTPEFKELAVKRATSGQGIPAVAKDLGLTIVADETYTPPLADATTLVQKIRSGRPDFIVFQSTNVGDDKLLLDKFAERGITASTVPLVGGGGHWTVPELLKVAGKEHLEGMIVGLANWPGKDLGDLEKRFVAKTNEPWFGHDSIFPYAHVMIFKEAIERTGSSMSLKGPGCVKTPMSNLHVEILSRLR